MVIPIDVVIPIADIGKRDLQAHAACAVQNLVIGSGVHPFKRRRGARIARFEIAQIADGNCIVGPRNACGRSVVAPTARKGAATFSMGRTQFSQPSPVVFRPGVQDSILSWASKMRPSGIGRSCRMDHGQVASIEDGRTSAG